MRESQERAGRLIHMELSGEVGWLRRAIKLILLWIIVCGIVIVYMREPPATHALQSAANDNNASSTAIHLVLQTAKTRYRVGEPIELTAYLENVSDSPYYVGNTFASLLGSLGLHDMKLEIADERNKAVVVGRGGGNWIWSQNTSVADKLTQAYVRLGAGMVHGLKDRVPLSLQPGRYRLRVTYREEEALRWTEAERAALPVPVWTQPLVSNEVMITVLP